LAAYERHFSGGRSRPRGRQFHGNLTVISIATVSPMKFRERACGRIDGPSRQTASAGAARHSVGHCIGSCMGHCIGHCRKAACLLWGNAHVSPSNPPEKWDRRFSRCAFRF
jgi:hypothetical protein